MIEKLIKAGTTILAAAMLAACGGENAPETGKSVETGASGNATVAAAPTKTPETEPARAQRLDHLLPSPTTKPEAKTTKTTARATDAAETKAAGKPTPTGETESATAPASPRLNITDLVPEKPTDQRPGAAAGHLRANRPGAVRTGPERAHSLRRASWIQPGIPDEVPGGPRNTPTCTCFPELKHMASQREYDISYIPFMSVDSDTFGRYVHFDLAGLHNGPTYFIYNPWFEQMQYKSPRNRITPHFPSQRKFLGNQTIEPYWFGDNSTRGILAETVTKLLEEAKLPSAEPYPRDWWTQKESQSGKIYIDEDSFAPRDWTLDEYIRTGVEYPGPEARFFQTLAGRIPQHPTSHVGVLGPRSCPYSASPPTPNNGSR